MSSANSIIDTLGLEPLPEEGGFFRRIHTGSVDALGRPQSTTIYALFTPQGFSALHRLDAVEQFFFLQGDAFEVFRIDAAGAGRREVLGTDLARGASPHLVFEPGCWFGGRPVSGDAFGWTLMSCVVTPGFQWDGFEIGDRAKLLAAYPDFGDEIRGLTRVHCSQP